MGPRRRCCCRGRREEEEQLLTCLSAQLFVSRSPRETEAAGSRKAAGQGPAPPSTSAIRPDTKAEPPAQERLEGASLPHLRRASLGPLCLSLPCRHPCAILALAEGSTLTGGRGGAGSSPGGSVLTRDRVQRGGQRSRWGSVLPGGRILTGEQGSPGGRVVQGSTSGLALAQTFPGPCLLCLPCELPSPWGQSR